MLTLQQLRAHATGQSLFQPTTLKAALERMSFVQADPIRSPARAQDLILRHRVRAYRAGQLERQSVDDMAYVWPAVADRQTFNDLPRQVRFLAPFDPLVWDRRRFEHLWGWAYRFEAYTPTAKRIRGYYAMPMLWGDAVIGWANVRVHGDRLSIEPGFVSKPPQESAFRSELERETESLRAFLNLGSTVSTSILWP